MVLDESPERVVVSWPQALRSEDTLVLRDACAPGWTARILQEVGAAEALIECADVMFRGVRVPAGARGVEFVYAPQSLRLGALLSTLGAAILLTLLTVSDRRRQTYPAS
jgi:uncharacterized membrane protein YfhO